MSIKFVVFSEAFKFKALFYKLRTTNFQEKGVFHDGKSLRATTPYGIMELGGTPALLSVLAPVLHLLMVGA